MASLRANSGSWSPTIWLDQWNSFMRSSWGTPSRPAMACSGSSQDTCSTKSPEPSAAAASTMRRARSWRSSRSRSTARGVKPREMILRRWVCCGASMLSSTNLPVSRCSRDRALSVARQGGVLQAGEDVAAPRDLFDVLVFGHHPEAAVVEPAHPVGLLVPPDRRGPAQLGQFFHRQSLGVDVWVGEVEPGRQIGGWHAGHSSIRIRLVVVLVPNKPLPHHGWEASRARSTKLNCNVFSVDELRRCGRSAWFAGTGQPNGR